MCTERDVCDSYYIHIPLRYVPAKWPSFVATFKIQALISTGCKLSN